MRIELMEEGMQEERRRMDVKWRQTFMNSQVAANKLHRIMLATTMNEVTEALNTLEFGTPMPITPPGSPRDFGGT